MRIVIVHVTDCPNVAPLLADIASLAAGRADVEVTTKVIETDEEAHACGFRGSPTVLVDGEDHFDDGPKDAGMSCRLYDTGSGLRGRPSRAQLQALLRG